MISSFISIAALAVAVSAQNSTNSSSTSLTDLLGATASLSSLTAAVQTVPGLAETLGGLSNITILAPSNEAFQALSNSSGGLGGAIQALLQYHVLNGTYPASAVTDTPVFLPTLLNDTKFSNVTGGQVVEAVRQGDDVVFYSGLLSNATVTTADQNFTGGIVHVIDTLLTIPQPVSDTAIAAGLSGVAGALTKAELVDTVDSLSDVTIFAPNNSAFEAIGSALPNLSTSALASILQYHVINGTLAYSSKLENGTKVPSLLGPELLITIVDGDVFVNSAKVLIPDVLVAGGVVHVIDNVLNPNNTAAAPQPTASVQAPAFSGASSVSELPLTSGIPEPSSAIGAAPTQAAEEPSSTAGGAVESSTSGPANPMRTGAMGAAALFAGAGVWLNA